MGNMWLPVTTDGPMANHMLRSHATVMNMTRSWYRHYMKHSLAGGNLDNVSVVSSQRCEVNAQYLIVCATVLYASFPRCVLSIDAKELRCPSVQASPTSSRYCTKHYTLLACTTIYRVRVEVRVVSTTVGLFQLIDAIVQYLPDTGEIYIRAN